MRRLLPVLVLAALLAAGAVPAQAAQGPPKLRHIFVIVLENENADVTFGPPGPPYLKEVLARRGAFLPNYYATGHLSLDNYISMVSGQAPNPETQADCTFYSDFVGGAPAPGGQVVGSGCVYPRSVKTVADQLEAVGKRWRGYMEDMAAKAPEEPARCRHPAINSFDDTQKAEVGDQYATRHNPFMYFHSIIDQQLSCDRHVVDLKKMRADLRRERTTPAYSFITPNLCHDGHDEPCVNGEPGGLVSANRWLKNTVPSILHSPGFKRRGLLLVTFDEAEASGDDADSSACCGEKPGPNTPSPGGPHPGPGGGRVGAVMLSPCIRGGTVDRTPYNHYSMLRSVEDALGLPQLGYAAQPGLVPFGSKTFTREGCGERISLHARKEATPAGMRTVRFRVHSRYARCRRDVAIRFAGRSERTNRRGRAAITTGKTGRLQARASKTGCLPDSLRVRLP